MSSASLKRPEFTQPPFIPVTVNMLLKSFNSGLLRAQGIIYENVECAVLSIVGWVVSKKHSSFESSFKIADGSCKQLETIEVDLQILSENQSWMTQNVEAIKEGDWIRVVGQPHFQQSNIKIRVLHFRRATSVEYTYKHLLEVMYVYLDSTNKSIDPATSKTSRISENMKENDENSSRVINLPDRFKDITDPVQRQILKILFENRNLTEGLEKKVIMDECNKHGLKEHQIDETLNKLEYDALVFRTISDSHFAVYLEDS